MTTENLKRDATIVHCSDLHLGENFFDSGGGYKASLAGFLKLKRALMQGHDQYILSCLQTEFKGAARQLGSKDDKFDFYAFTGDISTSANSPERFQFAYQYLTDSVQVDKNFSTGLGLENEHLLCIPGNHDVMWETRPERYLGAFGQTPSPPPYVFRKEARNGQDFIFYGIDSNAYGQGNIALGKITPQIFGWLSENFFQEKSENMEKRTIRILLVHHHPADLNPFRRQSLFSIFLGKFTVLEEGERLLELCKGNIDIIMHGHEHFPIAFFEDSSGCVIVSAGSTSEWQPTGSHENSFHVLQILGRTLKVHQFDWSKNRFYRDPQKLKSFELSNP